MKDFNKVLKIVFSFVFLSSILACVKDKDTVFVEVKSFKGDVEVNSQDDLDTFTSEGYIVIEGDLTITDNVNSLQGFYSLEKVKGDLSITNTKISNFDGLNNLNQVTGSIIISGHEFPNTVDSLAYCGIQPLFLNGDYNPQFVYISDDSNVQVGINFIKNLECFSIEVDPMP